MSFTNQHGETFFTAADLERERDAAVVAFGEMAATHQPMIAMRGAYVWVYCSCGFNKEYISATEEPNKWREHIRSLITPDAQAALAEHDNRVIEEETAELQASFRLRWNADMRAIKRWQEAHPDKEHVWPDHTDLLVWMLEQEQAVADRTSKLRAAYEGMGAFITAYVRKHPPAPGELDTEEIRALLAGESNKPKEDR